LASKHAKEPWVLVLADSLEELAEDRDDANLSLLSLRLRCLNASESKDSNKFIKYNNLICELLKSGKITDASSLYFEEMMDVVYFYKNTRHKRTATKYAIEMANKAEQEKDHEWAFCFYHVLGDLFYEKDDVDSSNESYKNAIKHLEATSNITPKEKSEVYDCLARNHNQKKEYYEAINYGQKALEAYPTDIVAMACLAESYYFCGNNIGFRELYEKVVSLDGKIDNVEYKYAMQYIKVYNLLIERNYSQALKSADRLNGELYKIALKREIYLRMRNFESAGTMQERFTFLKDSLNNIHFADEMADVNSELQALYEAKDQKLIRQKYLLIIGSLVVIMICIAVGFIVARYKTVKRKNKALIANIDQLITYREKVLELEREMYAKQDNVQSSENSIALNSNAENDDNPSEGSNDDSPEENATAEETYDDPNIARFVHELVSRKLFTDPNFNRETLIEELHVQKRFFTKNFEAYTGSTFKDYITSIRLEYAVKLIKEHPEWTIEAIAMECGIASYVTFHRNFTKHFGIAPSSYRAQM